MLRLFLIAILLSVCSATKPTNTTYLQYKFHGSVAALNQSATKWFGELHDQVPSGYPGLAAALAKLSIADFGAAVLALAQRNVTVNSPICANDSHLPIRKCLGRSNATTYHTLRTIVTAQERACKDGISSLVNNSFETAVRKCFVTGNSSCATQAPVCIQNLAQDLDKQLSTMLTHSALHKRDNVTADSLQSNYTALQKSNRKLAVDLTIVAAIGDAFAFLFFMTNPITETFLPFVFITVALGLAAAEVHRTR